MKKSILLLISVIYIMIGLNIYGETDLTEEELKWIEENPIILVESEQDSAPFNFVEKDEVKGFSVDYMNMIGEKTGLKIEYVVGPSWNEFLEMTREGTIDVMMNIIKTPEREIYLDYTDYYAKNINSILTLDTSKYRSLNDLKGKIIALPKGYYQEELLKRDYPDIIILNTRDRLGAVKAVIYGDADATLGKQSILSYIIKENQLTDLTISGEAKYSEKTLDEFHFAVKKGNEKLLSILNKGLKQISVQERNDMLKKWFIEESRNNIDLTEEERRWIEENPVIRVENEGKFPPLNFREAGEAKGYAVDLMDLVAEKLGLQVEYIPGAWDELTEMIKANEIDVMLGIAKTPEREKYMIFTQSFINNPTVIISRRDEPYKSLEELKNYRVAVPRGYYQEEIIRGLYPEIRFFLTETSLSAMKAVVAGKAEAYVGDVVVANYLIQNNFITGLSITGDAHFDEELEKIYMGTNPKNKVLLSILKKGIASITEEEKNQLFNKWFSFMENEKINITENERIWIEENKGIRIGVKGGRPPLAFLDSEGNVTGKVSDYINIISDRLGLDIVYENRDSWNEVIEDLKSNKIDIVAAVEKTEKNRQNMLFTKSYISIPLVLAVKEGTREIKDLKTLREEKIAVVSGSIIHKRISEDYPMVELVFFDDAGEGLKAISKEKVFGIIESEETIDYFVKKHDLDSIKKERIGQTQEIYFGVNKNHPELAVLLNKVIDSFSEGEKKLIEERWENIAIEKKFDWILFWQVIGVLIIVFIGIIIWNRKLMSEIKKRKEVQREMKRSEERFRIIADYTYDWESWFSPNGKLLWVNPGVERMFGYSVEECFEIKGFPLNLIFSDEREKFKESFENALKGKAKNDEIFKGIKKTGEIIWIAMSWNSVTDGNGNSRGVRSSARNFTERKRDEERIQASEEQSRLLLESASEGIFGTDRLGKATFINPSALEQLGYKKEEVLGKEIHELIHYSYENNEYYPIKECPMYKSYTYGTPSKSVKEVLWKKDGTYLNVEYTSTPILKDKEIMGSVIMFKDITERLLSERKLLEAKETSDKIIENSPIPIAIIDLESQELMRINKAMERFHGISYKEMHKYKSYEIYANIEKQNSKLTTKLEKEKTIDGYEIQIKKISSGERRWVMFSSHQIKYMERDSLIITIIDINDIKNIQRELEEAKEKAEAATRAKSDFLANMSHEIRTPMNAILGLNDLLKRTELTGKQSNYVEKVSRSAKNLLGIINDILDFSKIEAGKMNIELIPFNLDNVLEGLSNVSGLKAAEKGIEFVIEKSSLVSDYYIGDPLRIGQILLNLTNNAIKFTDKGEVLIKISSTVIADENVELKFEVKDTGIGLTEEQSKKLFSAFIQADASTTRKYGGTGLGLSISKQLIKLMGGEIGVDSVYEKGSNFYFTVPLKLGKEEKKKDVVSEISGLKVLVVDDNESARRVMGEYLKDFLCDVIYASSGEEAVLVLEEYLGKEVKIDLILMDLKMKGIDGIEAWKRIKSDIIDYEKLPKIILVTAYGREDIIDRARREGIETTLMKPLSQSLLFDDMMNIFGVERDDFISKDENHEFPKGFEDIRGAKILVAEDNLINQEVIKAILENEGFYVHLENNGQKIVDILETEEEFDIILMDLQMPVMDGYEAATEIRKKYSSKEIPIVALSADAMSGTRERVKKVGMDEYVTKPIDKEELYSVLVKFITKKDRKVFWKKIEKETKDIKEDVSQEIMDTVKGIDVEEGLKRVAGNTKLYIEILKRFSGNNRNFVQVFRKDAELARKEENIIKAHTLKGVAGNIGAKKIYELAQELENRVNGNKPYEEILIIMEEELQKICGQVDGLIGLNDKGSMKENNLDIDTAKKEFSNLKELLEDYDTDAQEKLEEIKEKLDLTKVGVLLEELEKKVNNYDFEEALEELEKLEQAIYGLEE